MKTRWNYADICKWLVKPIPVAVRSKAQACDRSIAQIAGSKPAEGMHVRLLCLISIMQVAPTATR